MSVLGSSKTCAAGQALRTEARRELDDARARWRTNAVRYYRLRVRTMNPLLETVTESDVRNGQVVVARGASGMPGVGRRPGSGPWGISDGNTVEGLFQLIEDQLLRPDRTVSATYDRRRGYPTFISTDALARVMDADVVYEIELIASPGAPLVAVSPGEAYQRPVRGRIDNAGRAYETLFGFGSDEVERIVRRVWPQRAAEIIKCGAASDCWDSVGWEPRAGLIGEIIGTLNLPDGEAVYVMEFPSRDRSVFLLIQKSAVTLTK